MQIRSKRVSVWCAKGTVALALATLAGCGGGAQLSDLEAFTAEVQARPPGPIEPLPVFAQVPPFSYQAGDMRSPFEPPVVLSPVAGRKGDPDLKPDVNRARQFLEQFPVANLTMVGTLSQGSRTFALVQDGDGGVHRVQRGDYMGTDHGQVLAIQETMIELIEIVPDGNQGWVERARTVALGGGDRG